MFSSRDTTMPSRNIEEVVLIHLYIVVRELIKRRKITGFVDEPRKTNELESHIIHFEFDNHYYKIARIIGMLDLGESIFHNIDKESSYYLIIDDTYNLNDFDVLDYSRTIDLYNKIMIKVNTL